MPVFNNLTPRQEADRINKNARSCLLYFVAKMQKHEQTHDQIRKMIGFEIFSIKNQSQQTLDQAIYKMTTFLGIKQFNK